MYNKKSSVFRFALCTKSSSHQFFFFFCAFYCMIFFMNKS